ncbi:hypothetical protein HID58_020532 [Brassica napus]|uniref:Uncharacterized protein n=1 Tax=Brassica napus TaxID=3708 RepID=A0ABQ7XGJ3_BRANA|nr:hypothetical protein HID58_020532 [Brassica napus]
MKSLPSIIANQGNLKDSTTEYMKFMLRYHHIHHPDSTLLIQETTEYVLNKLPNNYNTIINDLQVTLTIWDYTQNVTARLDGDLIITDLEETNMPPTTEEKNCML